MSVALLAGAPVGVVFIRDPDATAGGSERMAIEHAATVLAMRVARMRTWGETDTRLRINLVLDIIAGTGADRPAVLSRAQTLGYDLGRAHRVVVVNGRHGDDEVNGFFDAVSRAARAVMVGSLLAPRLNDVVVLADPEAPWEQFRQHVVAELHGGHCQVGVGGRCTELDEFPRSYQEAQLALRIQITAGGDRHVTLFDDLGVYKVLATANDMSALERFVGDWLGPLIRYDSVHSSQLVLTLTEYLDSGGKYDASARVLSVHRSTLKYRLRRIREVSGHDLGLPDTQFNLHFAARAWRTLQALRQH
jgi:DNA-binding PucR family transcriptional regulator